jgi:hypothetical protein
MPRLREALASACWGGIRDAVANLRTPRSEADRPHVSADRTGQDGRTRPFAAVACALAGVSGLSHAARSEDRVDARGRGCSRETPGASVDTCTSRHARASSSTQTSQGAFIADRLPPRQIWHRRYDRDDPLTLDTPRRGPSTTSASARSNR